MLPVARPDGVVGSSRRWWRAAPWARCCWRPAPRTLPRPRSAGPCPRSSRPPPPASARRPRSAPSWPPREPPPWLCPNRPNPTSPARTLKTGPSAPPFTSSSLYRYAFVTGDTTDLAAMSEEGCVFCRSTIDDATALHAGGGWANPWDREAPSVVYIPSGEGKEYCGVRMTIKSGESTSVNAKGEIQYSEARDETRLLFALRHHGDGWRVGQVSLLK
ncbi:DUF6318 family protein [Actinomyces timonensis]|uniref:DUF6318 family protein n=1 Tax=Actinomyces timonensis TaxID=1288391 RepID=A0AAU8N053_9ACTO